MSAVALVTDRCFCGALLFEDREFAAQAEVNNLAVRRHRCTAGHTHYVDANPPPPDRLKPKLAPLPRGFRRCLRCMKSFEMIKREFLCQECLTAPRCSRCGGRGKHYKACPRRRTSP